MLHVWLHGPVAGFLPQSTTIRIHVSYLNFFFFVHFYKHTHSQAHNISSQIPCHFGQTRKGLVNTNVHFHKGCSAQWPRRPSRGDRACLGPRPTWCSTTITLESHLSHLNIAVHKLGEAHKICLQICWHIGSICLERHITQK